MSNHSPLPRSLDALAEYFKIIKQCPVCEKEYGIERVRVVDNISGMNLIHITCPFCQYATMALLGSTERGLGLVGAVTDLSVEDVERLRPREALSEDELLNFSSMIQQHSHELVRGCQTITTTTTL